MTGLRLVLRLIGATMPLALLLSVTQMSDLSGVLVQRLHVPYKYAFTLTTAIRFIPVFADSLSGIMEAQTARGVAFDTKNPFKKLGLILPLCMPLLISSVGRIHDTAAAAEMRGFTLRTRESQSRRYTFKSGDLFAALIAAALPPRARCFETRKDLTIMMMKQEQLGLIQSQMRRLKALPGGFYQKKFDGIDVIRDQADFEKLPFTNKEELRDAYPLGIAAVPEEEIVRIHCPRARPARRSSSLHAAGRRGLGGAFKRCYEMAGITNRDRIHVTPGYGLWTAGIGFQNGAEKLGAMVIPMGPGNTDKQIRMMQDLGSTVLCATSSYALLLAEEIEKRGIRDTIRLKKGVIGSERWGDKMRRRIADELGVELYDIYGLTEVYGPGIGMSCAHQCGMHYWDDFVYFEIIDLKPARCCRTANTASLLSQRSESRARR